jgi:hypothetical protein
MKTTKILELLCIITSLAHHSYYRRNIAFPKRKKEEEEKVARQHSFRLNGKSFLDLLVDNPKKKLSKEETRKVEKFPISFFSSVRGEALKDESKSFLLLHTSL